VSKEIVGAALGGSAGAFSPANPSNGRDAQKTKKARYLANAFCHIPISPSSIQT
jgi:hypothetical protein